MRPTGTPALQGREDVSHLRSLVHALDRCVGVSRAMIYVAWDILVRRLQRRETSIYVK